ncbi:unnamed protein product [Microthlaspi erraticum]|uniref:Uncharacterized protein n=1 Tax=Microthlaspi erraticum TaxID=1685480 RepID=A0A6D2IXT7_9BRAS|nr:unnamed protein product [Microthlaspi erraticum]
MGSKIENPQLLRPKISCSSPLPLLSSRFSQSPPNPITRLLRTGVSSIIRILPPLLRLRDFSSECSRRILAIDRRSQTYADWSIQVHHRKQILFIVSEGVNNNVSTQV